MLAAFLAFASLPPAGESSAAVFPGEELVYRITALRFFSAGTAVFSVHGGEAGEPGGYRVSAEVNSSPPFSFFFRVRSTMESELDTMNFMPVRFEKTRREASFRRHVRLLFDRENGTAVPESGEPFAVPPGTQDYLSSFYYMRSLGLSPGERSVFTATGGRKSYEVTVDALRRESAVMRGREVDAVVMRVSAGDFEQEGLADTDSHEMLVWITDDDYRIPLKFEMSVSFGRVVMNLIHRRDGKGAE